VRKKSGVAARILYQLGTGIKSDLPHRYVANARKIGSVNAVRCKSVTKLARELRIDLKGGDTSPSD